MKVIDDYTYERFVDARKDGKPIHDDGIQFRALHKSKKFSSLYFEASRKRLFNFKRRHGIVSRKVQKLLTRKELLGTEELKIKEDAFKTTVKKIVLFSSIYDLE